MITNEELEILDNIGLSIGCGCCTKCGTDKCPNYKQGIKLQVVVSCVAYYIKRRDGLCKYFEYKPMPNYYAYQCWQKYDWLNLDKYIEYLLYYWWMYPKDSIENLHVSYWVNGNLDEWYYVKWLDYYNGTMFDEQGRLKVYKKVYKKMKRMTGWNGKIDTSKPLVYEDVSEPIKIEMEK